MKPILIRDEDGIQTFRNPETGEEFSTTISKPIPDTGRDIRLATLKCTILTDQDIAKQLSTLRSTIGSDATLNNQEMLAEARAKGTVTVAGLRIWKAEQILAELERQGFSTELIRE